MGESVPFGLGVDDFLEYLQSDGGGVELIESAFSQRGFHPDLRVVPVIANTGQAAGMFKQVPTRERFQQGFLMRTFGFGEKTVREAYPNMKFIGAVGGSVGNIVSGFAGTLQGASCPDGVGPCELQGAEFVNACIDAKQIYSQGIANNGVRYYVTTEWQSPATIFFLMFRADRFDDSEVDDLVEAAEDSLDESRPRLLQKQPACLQNLRATYGQTTDALQEPVLSDLRAAWDRVSAREAAANPWVAEALQDMEDFGN